MTLEVMRQPAFRDVPPGVGGEWRLSDYVAVLWRRRFLLLAFVAAAGIAAFAIATLATPIYEARATVLVLAPKLDNAPTAVMSSSNFRPLLSNRGVASRVIAEFNLDQPPLDLTPDRFVAGVVAVNDVYNTSLLEVAVRLPDPALAAKVLNRMLELALELNRRVSQNESIYARDVIKAERDAARSRKDELQTRLLAFKRESQLDLVRRDVDVLLGQRGDLARLLVAIEAEKSRIAAAQKELPNHERIHTLNRSIDKDPALLEAARAGSSAQGSAVLDLTLSDQLVNPVYKSLEQQIADGSTMLAALEQERDELVQKGGVGGSTLAQLTEFYRKEIELAALQADFDLATRVYTDLATRYEQARVQVTSRSADLQVIDPAMPPARPVWPRRGLMTLTAVAGALLFGVILVIVGEFLRRDLAPVR